MSSGSSDAGRTCPSAACEPGAILLGLVDAGDRVGYLSPPLRIDEEFVSRARRGRSPEKRFRFAAPCVEAGCRQWSDGRCGVIDEVLASAEAVALAEPGALPRCAIRSSCRWYAQVGREACEVCPLIITDCR